MQQLADPLFIEKWNQERRAVARAGGVIVSITTEDTSGTSAVQPVYHGLGRIPSSVTVHRSDSSLTVSEPKNIKPPDDQYVYIKASAANVVADIKVV